jgi:hypothetical protein
VIATSAQPTPHLDILTLSDYLGRMEFGKDRFKEPSGSTLGVSKALEDNKAPSYQPRKKAGIGLINIDL